MQTSDMMYDLGIVPFTIIFQISKKKKPVVKTANIYLLSTCRTLDTLLTEFLEQAFELVLLLSLLSRKETKGKRNNIPQVTKMTSG